MPVLISAYDEKINSIYTESVFINENGNETIIPKASTSIGNENVDFYALPKGSLDEVANIILSIDKTGLIDWNVWNIILEEADSYFYGQKTAEEVAALIQNRVSIYVSESQ